MSPEIFDFDLGVKVSAPVKATGRVKPGELQAAKAAHTVYSGPYEGLPTAWGEFNAWIRPTDSTLQKTCGTSIPSVPKRQRIPRPGALN